MKRVLLNEPVIKYRDFSHILPLLSPKHVGGLTPLGHMDDAILIVSNEFLFCLSFLSKQCFPDRAMKECKSRPKGHEFNPN